MERPPLVEIQEAAEDGDAGGNDGQSGFNASPDPEVHRVGCMSWLVSVIPVRKTWAHVDRGSAPKSGESMAGNLAVLIMQPMPALDSI